MSKDKHEWDAELTKFLKLNDKNLFLEEELAKKRQERKLKLMMNVTVIYFAATALTFYMLKVYDSPLTSKGVWDFETVTMSRIIHLEQSIDQLQRNLSVLTASGSQNIQLNQLSFQINEIKNEQKDIAATIIGDYDQALTSRLLREKQKTLEDDLRELKFAQTSLNEKFDDFMVRIFTAPLIGVGMTLLIGFITWLYQKFSSNNNIYPETSKPNDKTTN